VRVPVPRPLPRAAPGFRPCGVLGLVASSAAKRRSCTRNSCRRPSSRSSRLAAC